jgi:hypothetical protein
VAGAAVSAQVLTLALVAVLAVAAQVMRAVVLAVPGLPAKVMLAVPVSMVRQIRAVVVVAVLVAQELLLVPTEELADRVARRQ